MFSLSKIVAKLVAWGFFALMGLGILAIMIWYYGPLLRFGSFAPLNSVLSRVVTIVVIFLIWGLYRLIKSLMSKKKDTEISKDLATSAEAVDPADEQSAEELTVLKDRFDEALKALKKSNVSGKKVSSIYQLPWYMIIGPPGSGKTTLLVNSGLMLH